MRFNLFRVSLVPNEERALWLPKLTSDEKATMIADALNSEPQSVYRNTKYAMFQVRPTKTGNGSVGILAHQASLDALREDEEDGEIRWGQLNYYDHTYFAYAGPGRQVIGVLYRPRFFSGTPAGIARILEGLLNSRLDERAIASVSPIAEIPAFWNSIRTANRLFRVEFQLTNPNVLGMDGPLQDILTRVNQLHNATHTISAIENENGHLKVSDNDPNLNAAVNYTSEGGGVWKIRMEDEKGDIVQRSSQDQQRQVRIKGKAPSPDQLDERAEEFIAAIESVVKESPRVR